MSLKTIPNTTLWSCVLGHGLEMYDFTLYGAFTTLIALHYFSQSSSEFSFLLALLALSVGYIARPLGAILFGYVGDIYGRNRSLILTISIASVATGTIGICPSYLSIGVSASIILFIARFLQGLCSGAETSDASVFLIENCPKERSSYGSSMIFLSGGIGCIIAIFVSRLFLTFDSELSWRLPFIIGFCVGGIVLYLRFKVSESSEFLEKGKNRREFKVSFFVELVSNYTAGVINSVACGLLSGVTSTTIVVFVNLYLHKILGFDMADALSYTLYGLIPFIISCYACSRIPSNRFRNKVIIGAITGLIIFAVPYFYLVASGLTPLIVSAQVTLGALSGTFIAPINSLLAEKFPPEVRCTGVSVGYNTGYAITSGLYPILAFKLIEITENIYTPAIFILIFASIALISVLKGRKESQIIGGHLPDHSMS